MLRERKPIRTYHGEKFHTNRTNKKHLAKDFGHRCAYCDDPDIYGGGFPSYHVEHFAPKSRFPELEFDYDNLLYACPWCNRAKSDTWPSGDPKISVVGDIGFIDPCTDEYDQHLERMPDGSIKGTTPLGEYMYKALHLYLKRHAIIHNANRLKQEAAKLKDAVAAGKAIGKDCSKEEAALHALSEGFLEYFGMLEEVSKEID